MAEREMRAERRMSDVEALMWNLEKDPRLSASIANVTILDCAPDPDGLRMRLERALEVVPRLRQRVVPALGRLAPPEWRIDPDVDLDHHLRWQALPPPGTTRQLYDVAMQLALDPFDRTRPLWEFTVVEGLEGGRAAMVQKLHHTVTDGEGGIRMSEQFIDLARDATEPITSGTPFAPEPGPSNIVESAVDTVVHNVRRGLGVGRRIAEGAAAAVRHPEVVMQAGADTVELARSAIRQLAVTDQAHSPLWTARSLRRTLETLRVPMDDAKRAGKELGGSLNDLFVTAAAGGAAAYHRAKGAEVDELRISMPVSTRRDGSAGGNSFSPTRVLVPAGVIDPAERFAAVRDRLTQIKGERALSAANGLAGIVNVLPTSMLVRLAINQVQTVDFAISNVRGAPFELFIAGARIEANYPVGPTGGTAFNITLMSYNGSLDMGLNIDRAAIDDPGLLRGCIEDSFAELLAL